MIHWLLQIVTFLCLQNSISYLHTEPQKENVVPYNFVSTSNQSYGWAVAEATMSSVEMNIQ